MIKKDENSSIKFVSYYSCYFNKYFGIAANSSNSERNMSDKYFEYHVVSFSKNINMS